MELLELSQSDKFGSGVLFLAFLVSSFFLYQPSFYTRTLQISDYRSNDYLNPYFIALIFAKLNLVKVVLAFFMILSASIELKASMISIICCIFLFNLYIAHIHASKRRITLIGYLCAIYLLEMFFVVMFLLGLTITLSKLS